MVDIIYDITVTTMDVIYYITVISMDIIYYITVTTVIGSPTRIKRKLANQTVGLYFFKMVVAVVMHECQKAKCQEIK